MQQFVLFTPLVAYDENFEPVPRLARSWEFAPDGRSVTFNLRDDLYWHDGVKTTAYDVKFSYDRARDPATAFANSAFWDHYGEATVVDSFTIRIAMEPHADPLDPWRSFAPVPMHVLGDVPAAQLSQHPFATQQPLGNGPFRFVSRAPGQNWVFEANPDFPEELGGRPYLDRIVYRVIPEPTTLLAELLNGTIHYYIAPPTDQVPQIESSPNARILSFDDRAFVLIGWNQRNPLFADARVRRALTMAIDRERIVEAIRGTATARWGTPPSRRSSGTMRRGSAGTCATTPPAPAPSSARRGGRTATATASWRTPRGALPLHAGDQPGEPRAPGDHADHPGPAPPGRRPDAQPQIMEWGALLSRINDPVRRDYEALVIGWVTEFRIDDANLFHCDRQDEPYQWVSHCNPRLDALIDTLPRIMDRGQAGPLWREYQQILAEDQPYTILFFQRRLEGVHNALRNVQVDARGDWVSVSEWYLHPDRRGRGPAASPAATDTQP
jgi:peptide/nickel transport system substrate-binding protein